MSLRPPFLRLSPLLVGLLVLGLLPCAGGCSATPPPPRQAAPAQIELSRTPETKGEVSESRTDSLSFPLATIGTFHGTTELGRIDLVTDPQAKTLQIRATVTLKASTDDLAKEYLAQIRLSGKQDGPSLLLQTDYPPNWRSNNFANRPGSMSIDLQVTGPPALTYDLTAANGSIFVQGITGNLHLTASNGDIDAGPGVDGTCELTANHGSVKAVVRRSEFINVSANDGNLDMSYSGTEPFTGQYAGSVNKGNLTVTLPPISSGHVSLNGSNGELTATLPKTSTCTLQLDAPKGKVILTGAPLTRVTEQAEDHVRGQLNGVTGTLQLSSMNGSLTLNVE